MSAMATKDPQPAGQHYDKKKSDADLMLAIAKSRDQAAFQAVYEKFNQPSLNLAFFLTGNRVQAEEAVQEAMIRIWKSAHLFKPGSLQSWILRIVSREALRVRSKNKRYHDVLASHETEETHRRRPSDDSNLEKTEILRALRIQMQRLSEKDRTIAGLYFGSELSQDQIALELGTPQRTISFRLKTILQKLQENLSQAGFAASGVLDAAQIREALLTGTTEDLGGRTAFEAVLQKVEQGDVKPIPNSQYPKAAMIPAALIFGTMAIAWGINTKSSEQPRKPSPPDSIFPTKSTVQPTRQRYQRTWTFENGLPEGLRVAAGQGVMPQLGKNRTPIIFGIQKKGPLVLAFAKPSPTQPFVIEVSTVLPHKNSWEKKNGAFEFLGGVRFYFLKDDTPVTCHAWGKPKYTQVADSFSYQFYCVERYVCKIYKGQGLTGVLRLPKGKTFNELAICLTHVHIEKIEIRGLAPDEIPENMKDLDKNLDDIIAEAGLQPRFEK